MRALIPCRAVVLLALGCLLPASAMGQTETTEYYGLDAIGSVRVVFDAAGTVLTRVDNGPFGEQLTPAPGAPNDEYAGLFRDDETGLDYAQARQYSPRTGRFTSIDPATAGLLEPQAWNRYSYAKNSPLNMIDPDGRCSRWISFGGTNSSGQSGFWAAECSATTNPYDVYRGDGSLVSSGSGLGSVSKDLAAGEAAYTLQTAQKQVGPQSTASVSTSTVMRMPDGKEFRPGETDDPFVRLAESVADRSEALQNPRTYVEFFALSAGGGAMGAVCAAQCLAVTGAGQNAAIWVEVRVPGAINFVANFIETRLPGPYVVATSAAAISAGWDFGRYIDQILFTKRK
jgi:RHS repeat-associated protein